jgi:hypothetical protein
LLGEPKWRCFICRRRWSLTASAKNRSIPLPCVFFSDVLCSHRKAMQVFVMAQCFECCHYLRFMAQMDAEEEREDSEFLEEQERVNAFARCLFQDCFCDGAWGKLVCFGCDGDSMHPWTCPRFDVSKLKTDSALGQAYLALVGGVTP